MLYCEARKPTQFRPPLAVQPGSGGLPNGLLEEGLVDEMSKPVWEYESPKVMRYLRAQLSGSAVLEVDTELVVEVRVEVTKVVEVEVVMTPAEEDVLVGPAVLLAAPGTHWSVHLSATMIVFLGIASLTVPVVVLYAVSTRDALCRSLVVDATTLLVQPRLVGGENPLDDSGGRCKQC